jgi:hypothetical protein
MGYAGKTESSAVSTVEFEQAYLQSLQHFVATNQHNAETFSHLSVTNVQLAKMGQYQGELLQFN